MDELLKQIEDDRKALAEIGEVVEDEEELEIEEETVEEPVEDTIDDKEEETVEEPVKEEPKKELDDAGYARLRREAQMEKERAAKLEKELAELRAGKQPEVREEVQEQSTLPPELAEVVEGQRYNRAAQEFERLQNDFKVGIDDFDDVTSQYHAAVVQSIAIQNPDMSPSEIQSEAVKTILRKAGQYMNAGYNPIEKMYNDAKRLGFKKREEIVEEAEPKKDPKPDMAKLAANRQRSAGTVAAPGAGGGVKLTREMVANLPVSEYAKLSREERQKYLTGS